MRKTSRIEPRVYERILVLANIDLSIVSSQRRLEILEITKAIYLRKALSPRYSGPALTDPIKYEESRALIREVVGELIRELQDEFHERYL